MANDSLYQPYHPINYHNIVKGWQAAKMFFKVSTLFINKTQKNWVRFNMNIF